MARFGKKTDAIGFAVYLDRLERFGYDGKDFDVDCMVIYEEGTSASDIINIARQFGSDGSSVRTLAFADATLRCRKLVKLGKDGLVEVETHD